MAKTSGQRVSNDVHDEMRTFDYETGLRSIVQTFMTMLPTVEHDTT